MITLEEQPYEWSARGQKLIYRASSDETSQMGFKYIVRVADLSTLKNYEFLYDPTPFDDKLYFDLNPLVYLRNWENKNSRDEIPHYIPFDTPLEEPETFGYCRYDVEISEGWVVNGLFTENVEGNVDAVTVNVFNAYLQAFYGFRPDPDDITSAVLPTVYLCNGISSYMWSDRWRDTHTWDMASTFGLSDSYVYIPANNTDWGCIALPAYLPGIGPLSNNAVDQMEVNIYHMVGGVLTQQTETVNFLATPTSVSLFLHVGIYPKNLIAANILIDNLDWYYYTFEAKDSDRDETTSRTYVVYNAQKWGQHDCRNDIIRIAWVSMRGGWDYFNFIKRSDITNQVDRKQFIRRLNNNTEGIFYPNQRQTIDTLNINERTLTVTSDWIQENEFIYLKNLFNSNQVQWLTKNTIYPLQIQGNQNPEQAVPVSLIDTNFTEQRGRNGKLVNVTLKFKITQNYWT